MAEIISRIAPANMVELVNDQSARLNDPMSPNDAAFLARSILACAISASAPNAPPPGTMVGDAHLPIMSWRVGSSHITGDPILALSIPGIELTFVMTPQGAADLGAALLRQGQGTPPPGGQSGTVH